MNEDQISVFLVDDHKLFLSGVRSELGAGFTVVGEAAEVESAISAIRSTHPEVVLVDVHMPGGGGAAVIEAVLETDLGWPALCWMHSEQREPISMIPSWIA